MTSFAGSSFRGRTFAVGCEIDAEAIRRLNSRLLELEQRDARNAMRRGFGKWGRATKKVLEANAPFGKTSAVERVRGSTRPNVHLKWNVITKVKGYSKGLVTWIGVGVKRVDGSYLTPHWYHGWLENGHAIKRATTVAERILLKQRGERGRALNFRTIGFSRPRNWIRKWRTVLTATALQYVEPEVDRAVKEAQRG
jgi:hypothetical protein